MNYFNALLPYQKKYLRDNSRFKFYLKARQIGISQTQAIEIVDNCLTHNDGIPWIVLSSGEEPSKEFLMRCATAIKIVKPSIELHLGANLPEPDITATKITFHNGKRIIALPANPSTARTYSGHVVLDEFAHHDNPDDIWAATYPIVTSPFKEALKLRIISTPCGQDNLFFKLWHGQNEFSKHMTTIHNAKEQGFNINIEATKRNMLSESLWQQEYECVFLDASNFEMVITNDVINSALKNPPIAQDGTRIAFIDFGGTVAETVIAIMNGNQLIDITGFIEVNEWAATARCIAKLKEFRVLPENTYGDISGIGKPFLAMFNQQGFSFNGVDNGSPSVNYANKGAEMWYDTKDAFLNHKVVLKVMDEKTIKQLTSRRADFTARGLGLERKAKMQGRGVPSPDRGDAVCGVISCAKYFLPNTNSMSMISFNSKDEDSWQDSQEIEKRGGYFAGC